MSRLAEQLSEIEDQLHALRVQAQDLMENAEVTDELLDVTLDRMISRDRYVLIRPDGYAYWDVPFFRPYPGTSWSQRPAALRAARGIPGCRVYDTKDRKVVTA